MGKGDKKSRRGKITIGSYGKTRPRKKSKGPAAIAAPKKEKAPAKAKAKPVAAEAEAPAKKPAAKKAAKKAEE